MKLEMSKTKRRLCLIALMMTNFGVMADLVIIPIIGTFYQIFGDNMAMVNFIVSGPALIIVLISLLAGAMIKKIDKKIVILIGCISFAIGGICGAFVDNVYYIAGMRTLVGIGAGIVQVVAVSYIADIYEDATQRAKVTGYYNATMSFVGIAFSYFSGIIAANGKWQDVFNLYWVAVPMLIFVILFVPSIRPAEKSEVREQKQEKEKLGAEFWRQEVFWFLSNVLFGATVLYYVAVYITENGIGDEAFAGMATSVKQLVGFLFCFAFGFLYGKFKQKTIITTYIVAAVTLVLMVLWPSAFAAVVIATVCGCCYKVAFSYIYAHGFAIVPASRSDDATAISTAVYGIGTFVSTYYASMLLKIMHTDKYTPTFMVSAVIFGIMAIIELICYIRQRSTGKLSAEKV
jgi:MFS family permease